MAVACAAEIQVKMRERNADVPESRRIEFRAGIFDDGVNLAARLEGIAMPGGIAVSGAAATISATGSTSPSVRRQTFRKNLAYPYSPTVGTRLRRATANEVSLCGLPSIQTGADIFQLEPEILKVCEIPWEHLKLIWINIQPPIGSMRSTIFSNYPRIHSVPKRLFSRVLSVRDYTNYLIGLATSAGFEPAT